MLHPQGEGGWARRMARTSFIAAVLLFVIAPWLPHERADAPANERIAGHAARGVMAMALTAEAGFIPPAGRAAFAFEALLLQRLAATPLVLPGREMTADDFRRQYEGDAADYADLVFADR